LDEDKAIKLCIEKNLTKYLNMSSGFVDLYRIYDEIWLSQHSIKTLYKQKIRFNVITTAYLLIFKEDYPEIIDLFFEHKIVGFYCNVLIDNT
jgi:hypothetical protein